jgi:hypothetical protein
MLTTSPLVNPFIQSLRQTTATAGRAAELLRKALPGSAGTQGHGGDLSVQLPRRETPTYVLANQRPQPWELLPMKAAAMAQYPNFFNNSAVFFGSLNRDVTNNVPFCLIRPSRLAIDLAKVGGVQFAGHGL